MKTRLNYLFTLCFILLSANSFAQSETDTTFIFNEKKIKVQNNQNEIKVKVFNLENNKEYKQIFEGIYTDDKSYERWTVKEKLGLGDFDIFSRNKSKKKKKRKRIEPTWGGIGWGFNTITDGNKFNNIDGIVIKGERSNEFFINPFEAVIFSAGNNFGISSGLGFSWHNLFLENNTHFVETNDFTEIKPAPSGSVYNSARLRTFQINIPLLIELQARTHRSNRLYLSTGVVGGLNVFSSQRIKYLDSRGKKIKEVDGKGLNISRITMDVIGQIGYEELGVFVKYSPFSMFQKDKGPDVQTASIGIKLNFN